MSKATFGGLALALLAGIPCAFAQDVASGDSASATLFAPKAAEVEMTAPDLLPKDQSKVLKMVARDQLYYAAIAISPDEGLMSEATVAAANYHSVEAASAVALAECNAKKTGAAECVVAAVVRPEGWQPGGVQLSSDATAAFQSAYDGGAMALSAATGSWGIGADEAAAIAACVEKNPKAVDCAVAIKG
ncbi:5-aminolevulic acid synthase [Paragemmobacter straminiformis]|uniref:5-aminolevulic acid synthase n=1 Tax=Paragemmobacter straminiformis TaxID=2045119 RepID=A0A842I6E4_9RHOB|nr:5-aminolevulic acid synthase [Gemmobacter straminiformis]MBC2835642.1 5-aminolevulic acid synthase [Gemmobacter straminiformis]